MLLVEDSKDDEDLTFMALKENKISSNVVVCRNGAEALDYLFCRGKFEHRSEKDMPRLILLDLKLPKLDGLELLRRVRSHQETKLIPVVVLTTSVEEGDILESYNLLANSYIRKPVVFEEFASAIKQISMYWLQLNLNPPQKGCNDE